MNFYGRIPGPAKFRNKANLNQFPPLRPTLSVYAYSYEKIYFGVYYVSATLICNLKYRSQQGLHQWDVFLLRGNIYFSLRAGDSNNSQFFEGVKWIFI